MPQHSCGTVAVCACDGDAVLPQVTQRHRATLPTVPPWNGGTVALSGLLPLHHSVEWCRGTVSPCHRGTKGVNPPLCHGAAYVHATHNFWKDYLIVSYPWGYGAPRSPVFA